MVTRRASVLLLPTVALAALVLLGTACDREDNLWDAYDPARKQIAIASDTLRLAEGGEPSTFRVALQMVPDDTVHLLVAADDSQIVARPETVIFAPVDDDWARPREVSVSALEDMIAEGLSMTGVTLEAVSADVDYDGQGGEGLVPVIIVDNDTPGIEVSEEAVILVESEGGAVSETYRVRLLSQPLADVTVTLSAAPADPLFHFDPATLVFTYDNWSAAQEVRLWADLDLVDADNATIVVSHALASTDPMYEGLTVPSVDVALVDDTLPPRARLTLASPGNTLVESGGTDALSVVVSLDRPSMVPVTVNLSTRDGVAMGDVDYVAVDEDLVFLPGDPLAQTYAITSLDDALMEDPEDFQVVISAVENVVVGEDNRLDLVVLDDDQITLSVAGVSTDEDAGEAGFLVSVPVAAPLPVTFTLTTIDGSATAGTDYDAIADEFVLPAGATSRFVPLVVGADAAHEGDEQLTATIGALSGNAVWDGVIATVVIRDDDPQAVRFHAPPVDDASTTAWLHLELDAPYNENLVLTVSSYDGDGLGSAVGQEDAIADQDFDDVDNVAWLLPAGTTRDSLAVALVLDRQPEATEEFFRLRIESANLPGFLGLEALATILDADQPFLLFGDATATEVTPNALFTVSLVDAAGDPVTSQADVDFNWITRDQTAEGGLDYTTSSGLSTIPAGDPGITLRVPILDDLHDDDNETFVLDVFNPVNATIVDDGTPPFCLLTDDEFPSINLAQTASAENEGTIHEFTVFLTTTRQDPTPFVLVLDPGTSDGINTDYTFADAGLQTIPPFTPSLTFQVPYIDDQVPGEADEVLQARLSNAEVALGVDVLDMTIVDAPAMNIAPDTAVEGDDLVFDVTLTAPSTADIVFDVQYSSGSANVLGDIDSSDTGPFTIPAGQTLLQIVTPTIAGDGGDEAVEDFVITIINPENATLGAFNSATGQITDGDPPPLTITGDALVLEGGSAVFTVALGWTSGANVSFEVSFADGTAAGAGIDYDDTGTGPFTIPAGSLSTTFAVPTTAGDGPEFSVEDFTVTVINPVNGVLGATPTRSGLIQDGDQPQLTIPAGAAATEGGDLFFTVNLDVPSTVPVFFDLTFLDGSTQGAADYTPSSTGPFSMMPGTTDTTITVFTVDDAVFEISEQFIVRVASPTNAVVGSPSQANGTINDND